MDISTLLAIGVSAIAVISTVAVPFITTKLSCSHEQKMYDKRFASEHAHEVIEQYIRSLGHYIFGGEFDAYLSLGEASAEIFMYAPKELWEDIRNFNAKMAAISQVENYTEQKARLKALQPEYLSLCEKFAPLRRESEQKKQTGVKHRRKN